MKIKVFTAFVFLLATGIGMTSLSPKSQGFEDRLDIGHRLMIAIMKKDEHRARSMVKTSVKIPEIRENTPIVEVEGLPSPKKNTRVYIAHFKEDSFGEGAPQRRMGFIWEITTDGEKISKIKVISDMANPFMNEPIREYRKKFNKELRVPMYYPFPVTHVKGKIVGNRAEWYYRNSESKLEIRAVPSSKVEGEQTGKAVFLKNGEKGFLKESPSVCQITFLYDGMQYTVMMNGNFKKPLKQELIQVVESMLPNT